MRTLRDADGMDWNEPFSETLLSGQDQRVHEEGHIVLGQSIISSYILDGCQFVLLVLALAWAQANLYFDRQLGLKVFAELVVWRRVALTLTVLVACSLLFGKLERGRITAVRAFFVSFNLYSVYLLVGNRSQEMRPWLLQVLVCQCSAVLAVCASPVLINYLETQYRQASFAHKKGASVMQTDLVSDVLGRNVRKARPRELGEICRTGFRRLLAARHSDLDQVERVTMQDFATVIRDRHRRKQAYLLFSVHCDKPVSKRRFVETCAEVIGEWHATKRSMSRSSSVFSVLTGLLDFCAVGLAGMFGMAVFGHSVINLIAAALFVYGIINGFLGVAITQWKMGAYFILGRHPYDIGDTVQIPGCGKGRMRVLDYSLTTSLFCKSEGQSLTVLHKDIAFKAVTNLSRPRLNMVVLTLSADEARGLPIVQVIRELLQVQVVDYFRDFKIVAQTSKYGLEAKPRIQLMFAEGLNSKQRLRGLVKFCSLLKEAALEAQVEQEGDAEEEGRSGV